MPSALDRELAPQNNAVAAYLKVIMKDSSEADASFGLKTSPNDSQKTQSNLCYRFDESLA